jgi:hypothetical protein
MLNRHPARESIASFLSLTITATPLAASDMPPHPQSNGEQSRIVPTLVDKVGAQQHRGAIARGGSPARSPLLPPHLTYSGRETSPAVHKETEGDSLKSLTTPPLISLFPVSSSSPTHQQSRTSFQPSISATSATSSFFPTEVGLTFPPIQPPSIPLNKL